MGITSLDSRSTSTAAFTCNVPDSRSPGAGRKPGIDVRPGALVGSAPGHDADVTARNTVYLCVGTAHFGQQRLRLAGWCDVVALGNHVKQVCPQPLQIDDLAPDLQFPIHQPIVAVE